MRSSGGTLISGYGEDESHNPGKICADCHYQAGRAEGWFTLAGTAYGNFSRGEVYLYTGPQGTGQLVDQVLIDRIGNFYTTEPIDYTQGLYAAIKDRNGNFKYMPTQLVSGQCNLCHGKSAKQLTLN